MGNCHVQGCPIEKGIEATIIATSELDILKAKAARTDRAEQRAAILQHTLSQRNKDVEDARSRGEHWIAKLEESRARVETVEALAKAFEDLAEDLLDYMYQGIAAYPKDLKLFGESLRTLREAFGEYNTGDKPLICSNS